MDPLSPVRADHRVISRLMSMIYKSEILQTPEILDIISNAYTLMGESWEKVFEGDKDSILKLKLLIVTAEKKGFIKKNKDWSESLC